ncbi:Cobalt-precorrin-6x reductase [Anaerovibrio sp. JC8]|uniref:precorrin-6A reductase n=1 Tax=Anaerovibrio sp. JC8 TaxID=1240085 RepID=UPI000A0B204B|nr:precorrin-6A reductase [Anaerovibrio sp. JC8]ORT99542.1 Cobalt-precorrin-6x reductase [Anaerovibrio sp. JC8]
MIFVAAGTQDGRELAGYILSRGYEVVASVVSQYGQELLQSYKGIKVNDRPLDEAGFVEYFRENDVKCFVDASHPYAANISTNAMKACEQAGVPYIRYERAMSHLDYDKAYYVNGYEEAAVKAGELGKNVFLTTGSRSLPIFAKSEALGDARIVCRILPESGVVKEARELGFTPDNIIAMQGPFSKELNKELFIKYNADVVVTKNSGSLGGADTKFDAVKELGLPLVIIDRPKIQYSNVTDSFDGVLDFLEAQLKK